MDDFYGGMRYCYSEAFAFQLAGWLFDFKPTVSFVPVGSKLKCLLVSTVIGHANYSI